MSESYDSLFDTERKLEIYRKYKNGEISEKEARGVFGEDFERVEKRIKHEEVVNSSDMTADDISLTKQSEDPLISTKEDWEIYQKYRNGEITDSVAKEYFKDDFETVKEMVETDKIVKETKDLPDDVLE